MKGMVVLQKTGPINSLESPCICVLPVQEGKVWWYYRKQVQLNPESHPVFVYYLYKKERSGDYRKQVQLNP